jgi:hypothetical protein
MTASAGGPCEAPAAGCDDPLRTTPCTVTVTMRHRFGLIAPMGIDFFGVHLGLPGSLTFERDSTYAMTDIDLSPGGP